MKWALNDRILNSLTIVLNLILPLGFGRTLFFGKMPVFYYFYVKLRLYKFNKLVLKNIGIIWRLLFNFCFLAMIFHWTK